MQNQWVLASQQDTSPESCAKYVELGGSRGRSRKVLEGPGRSRTLRTHWVGYMSWLAANLGLVEGSDG